MKVRRFAARRRRVCLAASVRTPKHSKINEKQQKG